MPTRLQFSPDSEWRARFEVCARGAGLDSSQAQTALARRALLRTIFNDGKRRTERSFGLAQEDSRKAVPGLREEEQRKTRLSESTEEDWDELNELLMNFEVGDADTDSYDVAG